MVYPWTSQAWLLSLVQAMGVYVAHPPLHIPTILTIHHADMTVQHNNLVCSLNLYHADAELYLHLFIKVF